MSNKACNYGERKEINAFFGDMFNLCMSFEQLGEVNFSPLRNEDGTWNFSWVGKG